MQITVFTNLVFLNIVEYYVADWYHLENNTNIQPCMLKWGKKLCSSLILIYFLTTFFFLCKEKNKCQKNFVGKNTRGRNYHLQLTLR